MRSRMSIERVQQSLELVRQRIADAAHRVGRSPDEITLVGATKGQPIDAIKAAVEAGLTYLGESKVQEALQKKPQLPEHVVWHMIGHLQRNKAQKAIELFDMIESVDSERIAVEISRRCQAAGKVMEVLLEVNVGDEWSKTGASSSDVVELARLCSGLGGIRVVGIMVIPPFEPDPEDSRPYFREARDLLEALGKMEGVGPDIHHLSMGMSHDYAIAVEEGATIVRVGTAIFGPRYG